MDRLDFQLYKATIIGTEIQDHTFLGILQNHEKLSQCDIFIKEIWADFIF